MARQYSRAAQYAGATNAWRLQWLDRRSLCGGSRLPAGGAGNGIAARHSARSDIDGLFRNRRKYQRNGATSRCLEKHDISSAGTKNPDVNLSATACITLSPDRFT